VLARRFVKKTAAGLIWKLPCVQQETGRLNSPNQTLLMMLISRWYAVLRSRRCFVHGGVPSCVDGMGVAKNPLEDKLAQILAGENFAELISNGFRIDCDACAGQGRRIEADFFEQTLKNCVQAPGSDVLR
jgi:hypothetical protein